MEPAILLLAFVLYPLWPGVLPDRWPVEYPAYFCKPSRARAAQRAPGSVRPGLTRFQSGDMLPVSSEAQSCHYAPKAHSTPLNAQVSSAGLRALFYWLTYRVG